MIKVLHHGVVTTIQDLGRSGYFHLGVPMSGAMDRFSARIANRLVGNSENAAVLESVFMGPKLLFLTDGWIAVTGGAVAVKIDGKEKESWTAWSVKAGQEVALGTLQSGIRNYIAIAGGITVPPALGSRSTYGIGRLGGVQGRALQKNDILPVGTQHKPVKEGITLPDAFKRPIPEAFSLRVLTGLYWNRLTPEAQKSFFKDTWQVSTEIDRMGYRFKGGQALSFVAREQPFGAGSDPSNIVDSCYPYGSIQVPGGLEPIILHRDAVSGGGYFTLGAVISADMDIIGQMRPNADTRFVSVTMEQALKARKKRLLLLDKIRSLF